MSHRTSPESQLLKWVLWVFYPLALVIFACIGFPYGRIVGLLERLA